MLKNIDSVILSIPTIALGIVGIGMTCLEEADSPVIRDIGWLGSRSVILFGMFCGGPLIVWSYAKVIFSKLLNSLTSDKIETLKNLENHCNNTFKFAVDALKTYPAYCITLLSILKIKRANAERDLSEKQQRLSVLFRSV